MLQPRLSRTITVGAALLSVVLLGSPARAQQAETDRLFGSAMMAQQRGEMQAAIGAYRKLLKLNPKLVDARLNLGAALARTGQFDQAIEQYRLALAGMPENPDVRRNLGLAYYKKGDLADAAREFETVRKRQPSDVSLVVLLADSEVRSGRGQDARAILTPLEAANAGNPDFEYVMATALLVTGARREAAARLEEVAEATQGADAYLLAGLTLLDLNESEKARRIWRRR